jgi:hypothetical protein
MCGAADTCSLSTPGGGEGRGVAGESLDDEPLLRPVRRRKDWI